MWLCKGTTRAHWKGFWQCFFSQCHVFIISFIDYVLKRVASINHPNFSFPINPSCRSLPHWNPHDCVFFCFYFFGLSYLFSFADSLHPILYYDPCFRGTTLLLYSQFAHSFSMYAFSHLVPWFQLLPKYQVSISTHNMYFSSEVQI